MKARVKSWEEIKNTLDLEKVNFGAYRRLDGRSPFFNEEMIKYTGEIITIKHIDARGCYVSN